MKKCLSAGAALALMLVIAACGGGSSGDNASTTADSGSAKPFAELRWASRPVRRADFQTSFDDLAASLVAPVEQGLVTFDPSGRVIPALASSAEERDDTTYVYRLREGVKFSDGKPLTVEDAVWSLKRNLAKDAQTAANYLNVESIAAEGSDVVVKLKRPDRAFPSLPAYSGQIIQKAAAQKGGVDKVGTPSNLPIGTGPYKFTEFSPDVGATLVPNPHWSGAKPTAQKITIKFLRDDSALTLAMRSGEVDGTFVVGAKRDFEFPGVRLIETPGTRQVVVSLNTIVEPFDDVHVRRAIAYATDREGISQAVMGGEAEVDETLTPISLYGNVAPREQVEAMFDALPKYDYDVEAAKAEMAKSRHPDGFTTTINPDPGRQAKIAQAMVPQLAEIGITLKVDEVTTSDWLAQLYGPRDKLGMMVSTYSSADPDPSSLMTYWLAPDQARVNGLNSANWKKPEVARLLEEQSQAANGAERLRLIGDIFRLMKEEVPYVTMFAPNQYMVISDKYAFDGYSQWTAVASPWPLRVRQAS